jgi:hemerythrin-like domain-containing protein
MSKSHPRDLRPRRAAMPLPPAFEVLDQTHRQVLEMLGRLAQLLDHVDDQGPDDVARASATAIHEFFSGHARQHHAAEESFVFPDLLSGGDDALVQHILRLKQDHGWLEEDWRELAPQIEAISRGYNWYDLPMLRAALPVFAALYQEHIALEESLVYPEAKRRLRAVASGESPPIDSD